MTELIFIHGAQYDHEQCFVLVCVRVCVSVYVCVLRLWLRWRVYLAADSQCRGGGDRSGTEPGTGGQKEWGC